MSEARDGATLALGDGRELRLAGIAVDRETEAAARDALDRLAGGGAISYTPASEPDRHGRPHACDVRSVSAGWLQGQLVDMGLALVWPFADDQGCVEALLRREKLAREARRGLWAGSAGVIGRADAPATLMRRVGRYTVVEGQILSVGERRVRSYLNFGTYWNEDFTVIIARRLEDRFADRLGPLGELTGRTVRVRGWIRDDRGPAIEAEHPEQIEIVDDG